MARIALRPQVGGALQVADMRIEEIEVPLNCEGAGKTIGDVRGSSVIVGLRRSAGKLEAQPASETVSRRGDSLVAIGSPEALERLESIFQPGEK
jgi:Trk K+ transport system NAD-binding subunit